MAKMVKMLFVGGPFDGERHFVTTEANGDIPGVIELEVCKERRLNTRYLRAWVDNEYFYLFNGISTADACRILLENYKPNR